VSIDEFKSLLWGSIKKSDGRGPQPKYTRARLVDHGHGSYHPRSCVEFCEDEYGREGWAALHKLSKLAVTDTI